MAASAAPTNASILSKRAYFIAGHGIDITCGKLCQWIVPYGCTIVVMAQCGVSIDNTVYKLEYDTLLTKFTREELLQPTVEALTQKLGGTYMIYKAGDPVDSQMWYSLIDIMNMSNTEFYYQNFAGIIDLDKVKNDFDAAKSISAHIYPSDIMTTHKISNTRRKDTYSPEDKTTIIDFLALAYQYSWYPNIQKIKPVIETLYDTCPTDTNPYFYILSKLKKEPILHISQEVLCRNLPPGVYYHFICREPNRVNNKGMVTKFPSAMYTYQHNMIKDTHKRIYPNQAGYAILDPNISSLKGTLPIIANVLKARISESLKRKAGPYSTSRNKLRNNMNTLPGNSLKKSIENLKKNIEHAKIRLNTNSNSTYMKYAIGKKEYKLKELERKQQAELEKIKNGVEYVASKLTRKNKVMAHRTFTAPAASAAVSTITRRNNRNINDNNSNNGNNNGNNNRRIKRKTL